MGELSTDGKRRNLKRGLGNTSIDFVFLYRSVDNLITMVIGESKYTQHYPVTLPSSMEVSRRLTKYLTILIEHPWVIPGLDKNMPYIFNLKVTLVQPKGDDDAEGETAGGGQ